MAAALTVLLPPVVHVPLVFIGASAVALSAVFGGRGPGLVTTALTGAWFAATRSVGGDDLAQTGVGLALFVAFCATVAHAAGWSRRAFLDVHGRRRNATRRIRGRLEFLRAITRTVDEGVYALDSARAGSPTSTRRPSGCWEIAAAS